MSNTIYNQNEMLQNEVVIPEYNITVPSLNDVNYATSLSEVFNNINDNFTLLANRDFVKGEQGGSVRIVEYKLYDEEEEKFTEFGNLLKNAIINLHRSRTNSNTDTIPNITDKNNNILTVWDNLNAAPGSLQMICNIESIDGVNFSYKPISSLYYVFLDGRFANNKLNNIEDAQFNSITDLSCVLIYNAENNNFDVVDHAFPTIYFEKEVGLCWNLNGNATGLPVQGPKGKDGKDAKLYIVKCDNLNKDNFISSNNSFFEIKATHIFSNNGYIPVTDYLNIFKDEIEQDHEYAAVILANINNTTTNNFYYGTIKLAENNELKALGSSTVAINTLVQNESLLNIFKNINIKDTSSSNMKGIFIPLEKPINATQKVHLLSATSITNKEGDNNLNTDIIWTPINDINSLNVSNNELNIDKYIYIKVNVDELCKRLNTWWGVPEGEFTDKNDIVRFNKLLKAILNSRNNILKYKLVNTVNINPINNSLATGNNVFKFINNSNVTWNTDKTALNITGAKCILSTTINNINTGNNVIGPWPLTAKRGNISKFNYDNLCYLSKYLKINNALNSSELKYGDINGYNTITFTEFNHSTGNSKNVTEILSKNNINNTNVSSLVPTLDSDRYSIIPVEFGDVLFNTEKNKTDIYRWVLDFNYHDFDPDDLKSSAVRPNLTISTNKKYKTEVIVDKILSSTSTTSVDVANIMALFNTIFTKTFTPSEADNILWFNGLTKRTDNNDNTTASINGTDKTIMTGWEIDPDIFTFIKYVPNYNNELYINKDTALNLNYNINVTGDKANTKKNVIVNGNISGDNIHIHDTAAIGLIKNVYTENEIIGNDGIKLGKINDNTYNFSVNKQGITNARELNANKIIIGNKNEKGNLVLQDGKYISYKCYTENTENDSTVINSNLTNKTSANNTFIDINSDNNTNISTKSKNTYINVNNTFIDNKEEKRGNTEVLVISNNNDISIDSTGKNKVSIEAEQNNEFNINSSNGKNSIISNAKSTEVVVNNIFIDKEEKIRGNTKVSVFSNDNNISVNSDNDTKIGLKSKNTYISNKSTGNSNILLNANNTYISNTSTANTDIFLKAKNINVNSESTESNLVSLKGKINKLDLNSKNTTQILSKAEKQDIKLKSEKTNSVIFSAGKQMNFDITSDKTSKFSLYGAEDVIFNISCSKDNKNFHINTITDLDNNKGIDIQTNDIGLNINKEVARILKDDYSTVEYNVLEVIEDKVKNQNEVNTQNKRLKEENITNNITNTETENIKSDVTNVTKEVRTTTSEPSEPIVMVNSNFTNAYVSFDLLKTNRNNIEKNGVEYNTKLEGKTGMILGTKLGSTSKPTSYFLTDYIPIDANHYLFDNEKLKMFPYIDRPSAGKQSYYHYNPITRSDVGDPNALQTRLFTLKIPFINKFKVRDKGETEFKYRNYNYQCVNGISLDIDNKTIKLSDDISDKQTVIGIPLENKVFTFFAGVVGESIFNFSNNRHDILFCDGANKRHNLNIPTPRVYLSGKVNIIAKNKNTEKIEILPLNYEIPLEDNSFKYPEEIVNKSWYEGIAYDINGDKYDFSGIANISELNNRHVIRKFNVKFKNINYNYKHLLVAFDLLSKNDIYKPYLEYENYDLYFNIEIIAHNSVAFIGRQRLILGSISNYGVLGQEQFNTTKFIKESLLTPIIYSEYHNSPYTGNVKGTNIGISVCDDWDNDKGSPIIHKHDKYFTKLSSSSQVSGDIVTNINNYNPDAPFINDNNNGTWIRPLSNYSGNLLYSHKVLWNNFDYISKNASFYLDCDITSENTAINIWENKQVEPEIPVEPEAIEVPDVEIEEINTYIPPETKPANSINLNKNGIILNSIYPTEDSRINHYAGLCYDNSEENTVDKRYYLFETKYSNTTEKVEILKVSISDLIEHYEKTKDNSEMLYGV